MSWITKILGKTASAAAGGVAGGVVDAAGKAADIVERFHAGEIKQHEMEMEIEKLAQDAAAAARSYNPTSTGGGVLGDLVNVITDAISRLIRPVTAVTFMGALFGWWHMETRSLDPFIVTGASAVLTFYFGARTITKDLPAMLASLKKALQQ
jgi:hypothetical protein